MHTLYIELREAFEKKRIGKKITKKMLLFENASARATLKQRPYDDYTQFRFVKEKLEAFTVDLQLYDGKLLHTTYEDREPIAMLIEDVALFTMQKNMFDALWHTAHDATLLSIQS
ncbi:MAG TPA: hypothetical protein DDW36_03750 [Candidatus Magasanikbacteria bacterium]|nr:hypothetical protein [Candidatus Magasanikbacteria bacterium]